jgi:transposase
MVYVGMDVHRKRTQVAVIDERGEELSNRNFPNDPAELAPALMMLDAGTPVVFEAAYGWGWLAELLDDLGLEVHLAHAKGCKAIASARLKNDKVDARTLAHLLRTDLLPEAWLAPREVRDLRALLRHRARLVRYGTSLKTRIHAVLADQGIQITVPSPWTKPGREWLAAIELPATQRAIVDDLLRLLDATKEPIARLEKLHTWPKRVHRSRAPTRRSHSVAARTSPPSRCRANSSLVCSTSSRRRAKNSDLRRRPSSWVSSRCDMCLRYGRLN